MIFDQNDQIDEYHQVIVKQKFFILLQQKFIHKLKNDNIKFNLSPDDFELSKIFTKKEGEGEQLLKEFKLNGNDKQTLNYSQSDNQNSRMNENLQKSIELNQLQFNQSGRVSQRIKSNERMSIQIKNIFFDQSLQNQQIESKTKLIEDFFVIGVDSERFKGLKLNSKNGMIYYQPHMIYRYLDQIQNEKSKNVHYAQTVPQLCYPKGVLMQKIPDNDQLDILNRLICNKQTEIYNQYIILLKSEQYLENDDQTDVNEVLKISNPYRHLYAICYEIESYVYNIDNKNNKTFYKIKNTLCILSYFPFFDFFMGVIRSYLDHVQKKKLEYYSSQIHKLGQIEVWQDVNQNFFSNYLTIPLTLMLDQLFNYSEMQLNHKQIFEILNMNYHLELQIQNEMEVRNLEINKGISMICQFFNPNMISTIILSLLLEISIVLISSNKYLLTVSMQIQNNKDRMIFKTLLHPFIWNHPIISILPQDLLDMFDSPVPLIIGLNDNIHNIQNQNLIQQYQKCIFVDIDTQVIYNQLNHQIPQNQFNNLHDQIDCVYSEHSQQIINRQLSLLERVRLMHQIDQQQQMAYRLFYQKVNNSIVDFVKNRVANVFIKIVIDYLRQNYNRMEDNKQVLLDQIWNSLNDQSLKQDVFMSKLIQTQNFQMYFDQLILNHY